VDGRAPGVRLPANRIGGNDWYNRSQVADIPRRKTGDAAGSGAVYAALVREAVSGDRDAMERLLMRTQEVAYRFSLLVCGHPQDAEDVMQDALIKTYQHVRQLSAPEAFRTWLYTTVRNACQMKRRRRVGEPSHFVPIDEEAAPHMLEVADTSTRADQQLVNASIDERLQRALAALPAAYRMIVVLREVEGLSTREVAEVTGLSETNVKTRLHRARTMLRRQLEGL
jgi:RNA polymerase sigma-70 factor (ECF subfamily)